MIYSFDEGSVVVWFTRTLDEVFGAYAAGVKKSISSWLTRSASS
jgi:hypothetical protein